MDMPFGQYEGVDIEDIPTSYLQWVRKECKDISQMLWDAINEELEERFEDYEED